MKIRGNKKLYWLAVPPLALAAGIGSIAGASWLNSGTGSVSVQAQATLTADTLAGSGASGIYPGDSGVPVTVTVTNHNNWKEMLTDVHVASVADQTTPAGSADISVTGGPTDASLLPTASPVYIPANGTVSVTGFVASMVAGPAGNPNDVYVVTIGASMVAHS